LSLEFVPLVFSWYDKGYGRVLGVLAKFMVLELGFFLKELHVILPSEGAARKHLLVLSSFHTTCESSR
jgi:hypothetical protein